MERVVFNVAPEILACIGEGRGPTVRELSRLADRIRSEVYGSASTFSCANADEVKLEQMVSFRLAQVALIGGLVATDSGVSEMMAEQAERQPISPNANDMRAKAVDID